MRRMRLFLILGTVLLLLCIGPVPVLADNGPERTDLTGVRVAVWGETQNMVVSSGIALYAMFEWMNATVEYVFAEDIRAGVLDNYDLLAMPGGQIPSYYNALDDDGIANIKQWIAEGGSYFGICGGALFLTSSSRFGIYNGTRALAVPGDFTSMHQIEMRINTSCSGPDLSGLPENFSTLFWGSSYFIPDEGFPYIPIARYNDSGEPGMIALEYEQGNAFLSSPHPEYEEGGNRDNTTEFDEFTDPDTEWDFLLRIAVWQIESSLTDNQGIDSTNLILVVAVAGVVVIAIAVVVILRRR
ncbi:MAG: BPL-N domain-containing protein [Candidatus Thorarchaeota archaeon]